MQRAVLFREHEGECGRRGLSWQIWLVKDALESSAEVPLAMKGGLFPDSHTWLW